MRLLLDENLPKKLKQQIYGHIVFTIREMGWNGISNGILLKLLVQNKFDALITFDQNIQHQQNFKNYSIVVIVLIAKDNTFETLHPMVPKIIEVLSIPIQPGVISIQQ